MPLRASESAAACQALAVLSPGPLWLAPRAGEWPTSRRRPTVVAKVICSSCPECGECSVLLAGRSVVGGCHGRARWEHTGRQ